MQVVAMLTRESRVRELAEQHNCVLLKSPSRELGDYMLVRIGKICAVAYGAEYGATLAEIEAHLNKLN